MRHFTIPSIAIFLLVGVEAEAKKVTLKCSEGYSIDVTFSLHIPDSDPFGPVTLSCPPDPPPLDVPDGYDGIHAEWDMTAPDGTPSSGSLPPAAPPGSPPPGEYAVWGIHPSAPLSYICNSLRCWEDPLAPSFIQEGEFLLGNYDEGTNYQLLVKVIDSTRSPLAGASVTVHAASDDTVVGSGSTEANGKQTFSVDAGGVYYVKVGAVGYLVQVSDEFQMLADHSWTMVVTEGTVGGTQLSNITLGIGILLIILALLIVLRRRRTTP